MPLESFLTRAEALLSRLEKLLPSEAGSAVWDTDAIAWRWRSKNGRGALFPVSHTVRISLPDLYFVERQKALLEQNTRQFMEGKPANNALLTGARGTGKSSLIRACLNRFAGDGLRLIEVDRNDLADLPEISDLIASRPERFILYCDDLSFDEGDGSYRTLKSALDGGIAAQPDNLLIYATSNRRHLLPERFSDNEGYTQGTDGEIHPGEAVEEKISFSDRFGLWLSFYSFSQDEYLAIVAHWLRVFGCTDALVEQARDEALQWALHRGSRSGRTAWQFARDFAGRHL
ncbi:MAG: ATP-binding protein [Burkholderiaceae bacterium]|nr:ATP-binding protein [Burkholderiaceae bacterium]